MRPKIIGRMEQYDGNEGGQEVNDTTSIIPAHFIVQLTPEVHDI